MELSVAEVGFSLGFRWILAATCHFQSTLTSTARATTFSSASSECRILAVTDLPAARSHFRLLGHRRLLLFSDSEPPALANSISQYITALSLSPVQDSAGSRA
ncbi:hypothetical protein B0H10DRAFT_2015652, partial [Mycena sp. CBHHK59/15]